MGPSGRGAGFRLVVDRLYGIRDAGVQGAVRIDTKVIEHHLRRVYEAKNPMGRWIESGMYQAVRDVLEEAVNMGMGDGSQGRVPLDTGLSASLAHSAEVFSAFKVHRMQRDMARLLWDDQGNLRSFREWRELVTPIAAHQVGPWLETEYSTAVLRAQQAVEWQQFEAEADVLPNLRWVPSTAVHPGADHQVFWNTILPIHHPFWDQHRPGDRWNCHCSLEATDEHPTAPPKGFELRGNGPQPGLNENPAKTGRLFAQSHPYFPQSCAQCAFYQGGIANGFKNQEKDCTQCRSLEELLELKPEKKGEKYESKDSIEILQSREKYDSYDKEKWGKAYFNERNGGFNVYHQSHQFTETRAKGAKKTGGETEKYVGRILSDNYAKQIEFLPENGAGTGKPDLGFDGKTWDVKNISKANENTIRKYIEDARKADCAIFYWDENNKIEDLKTATRRTIGKYYKRGEIKTLPSVYYLTKNGELKCLFDNS